MKLGTYSTMDCPTEELGEAYAWLQTEFEKIGGTVRKVSNAHDFGRYPSFEIDYPEELEFVESALDGEEYENEEDERLSKEKDDWHDKADAIGAEYNKKFSDFL